MEIFNMTQEEIEFIIQEEELKLIEHERSQPKRPKWWNIALGLIPCKSEGIYNESKEILREFLQFKGSYKDLTIFEKFDEFSRNKKNL